MGHSHGTLMMQNLGVGDYNLTLEAFNVFGVVDRSPVVCPFRVLAEGESINQTQVCVCFLREDRCVVLCDLEIRCACVRDKMCVF